MSKFIIAIFIGFSGFIQAQETAPLFETSEIRRCYYTHYNHLLRNIRDRKLFESVKVNDLPLAQEEGISTGAHGEKFEDCFSTVFVGNGAGNHSPYSEIDGFPEIYVERMEDENGDSGQTFYQLFYRKSLRLDIPSEKNGKNTYHTICSYKNRYSYKSSRFITCIYQHIK